MDELNQLVSSVGNDLRQRNLYDERAKEALENMKDLQNQLAVGLEAQQLLGSVADERSAKVLNYVTAVINKALSEIFPGAVRRIKLERTMYSGKHPHINVSLEISEGVNRDLSLQTGTGLRQIVSFLYRICLIEVNGARKLVVMDELLSGVHPDAMVVIKDLIKIFAEEGGFQFIMVEYGIHDDFGKMYEVKMTRDSKGEYATVSPLDTTIKNEED